MARRTLAPALAAVMAAGLAVGHASAQNVILDEGTFLVYRGGTQVGTETFTIRRVGAGADAHVLANAVVELELPTGRRELRPLLRAGADFALSAYQVEVSGDQVVTVAVSSTDRRFVARTRSESGEREREYRGGEGTLLLDEGVAHQYYFVGPAADRGGAVPVIVPRAGLQTRLDVRDAGTETIRIGSESVQARHVILSGGDQTHEVWFDARGRVLQVTIPSLDYRAVRTGI